MYKLLSAVMVGSKNYQTTIAGTGVAASYYAVNVGDKLPSSQEEWFQLLVSVLIQVAFLFVKDATVGSKPD